MALPDALAGAAGGLAKRLARPAQVLIVSSIAFTFISYWRTAAVVLCDLASTAYYIGGIVEQSVGAAAPWFILAVMLFSYAVRSVYIESCSLFVRGGVYRVVKEAMGGLLAKLSVSALMFDYVLTGPISGVSAGQYVVGLGLETYERMNRKFGLDPNFKLDASIKDNWKMVGSVIIASLITLYFFRKNLIGIHESSGKALKIMVVTTIMAVVLIGWCGLTLVVEGPRNTVPLEPREIVRDNPTTGKPENPHGFISGTLFSDQLRDNTVVKTEVKEGKQELVIRLKNGDKRRFEVILQTEIAVNGQRLKSDGEKFKIVDLPHEASVQVTSTDGKIATKVEASSKSSVNWLSLVGFIGLFIAFGHSILAMSGEETLAQVYREVESPKLRNFKKAAFIVFVYSLILTAGISFLAVMIIPNSVRLAEYSDNLLGGLAMNVWSPEWAGDWLRLLLNGFVVLVGFLILAGAVNTAIIGSNGVLNRVAEDGVMPDWFLKPHPRFGTTHRLLYLILGLQLFTIVASRGDVLVLGEAYAFGVVWSFVFKAMAMVVLRFRNPTPREYKVPFNIRVGKVEVPIGLTLIFVILLISAIMNLLTKQVATTWGLGFTGGLLSIFIASEYFHERGRHGSKHQHLEQFNRSKTEEITPASLGLTRTYRKLVAIRSPHNLFMLEKALAETDPETTGVVVMTAKVAPVGDMQVERLDLDTYDQQLMTAVVERAERAGKQVVPLVVPTNNPFYAVIKTAKELEVNELIMGASNKYTADEQMEQIAFYWISALHGGQPAPLTVRILSRDRDVYLDLAGGNRIPKITERKARSVAELRAAGVGVDRVILLHDGSSASSDLFQAVLTMLDAEVILTIVPSTPAATESNGHGILQQDRERAGQLGRELQLQTLDGDLVPELVRFAREGQYDLIILALPSEPVPSQDERIRYLLRHAHCRVFLAATPTIPQEVVDTTPSTPQ